MADNPGTQTFIGRLVFITLALVIVFMQLLPLDLEPTLWPAPDLLLAATFAWIARRPDYAPFAVIAVIFMLTDLLFQRPPGLWAALVLIGTEMIRARTGNIRNMPLMLEWGTVATAMLGVAVANRIVMSLVMLPQPALGLTLIQTLMTIASYPLVVLAAQFIFGVYRPAPGQVDSLGHRL